MSEVDPNRKVRVALDADNFCIMAGDPNMEDKETKAELYDCIQAGYTIKTIPYSEYKKLKWVYDKK